MTGRHAGSSHGLTGQKRNRLTGQTGRTTRQRRPTRNRPHQHRPTRDTEHRTGPAHARHEDTDGKTGTRPHGTGSPASPEPGNNHPANRPNPEPGNNHPANRPNPEPRNNATGHRPTRNPENTQTRRAGPTRPTRNPAQKQNRTRNPAQKQNRTPAKAGGEPGTGGGKRGRSPTRTSDERNPFR